MPLTMPTGTAQSFRQRGAGDDVVLADVQTADGTIYYFSDCDGVYPMSLGAGGDQVYSPWLKPEMTLQITRTLRTDLGQLALENITGNSIERDVATRLINHEFEGAFCLLRFWDPLLQAALEQYSAFLTNQQADETVVTFDYISLIDSSQVDGLELVYASTCPWAPRFKTDPRCGSAGAATTCDGTFTQCADASRAATERFAGVPIPPPLPVVRIPDAAALPDRIPGPCGRIAGWTR